MSKPQEWNIATHGLIPLAEGLEAFADWIPNADDLRAVSVMPSNKLSGPATARTATKETAGRLELVRRWLRLRGHTAIADEIHSRWRGLMDSIRSWETLAARQSLKRLGEWHIGDADEPQGAYDLLGSELAEQCWNLVAEASELADYLRTAAGHFGGQVPDTSSDTKKKRRKNPRTQTRQMLSRFDAWLGRQGASGQAQSASDLIQLFCDESEYSPERVRKAFDCYYELGDNLKSLKERTARTPASDT